MNPDAPTRPETTQIAKLRRATKLGRNHAKLNRDALLMRHVAKPRSKETEPNTSALMRPETKLRNKQAKPNPSAMMRPETKLRSKQAKLRNCPAELNPSAEPRKEH